MNAVEINGRKDGVKISIELSTVSLRVNLRPAFDFEVKYNRLMAPSMLLSHLKHNSLSMKISKLKNSIIYGFNHD